MKKKIFLGVSLFLMLLTLFALSINAASTLKTWDISATSSDNVTATLYSDYSLVISGSGKMKDWDSNDSVPWYSSYYDEIKSVTIKNGVTNIGKYAFAYCEALTSAVIGDSVTTIGDYAFQRSPSLTNIVIPDSVTNIGIFAFQICKSLKSIVIPDGVTNIGSHTFDYCTSLTSVVIPNSVTSIGDYAFTDCKALTSIEIGNGVTSIGASAFRYCTSLTSVVVPNSVTSIGDYAFSSCSKLTIVVIPDSVTTIGSYAFYFSSTATIYCEATSRPSGWKTSWNYSNCPVEWGHTHTYDFETDLCVCGAKNTYVEKWNISATESDNVTATLYDDGSFVVSGTGAMKDWTSYSNAPWYSSYRSKIKSVIVENGVTTIGNYAFSNCTVLTSVVIPDSVTYIGNYAFSDCTVLTSVVIPDSVTYIGNYAFYNCDSLTSIEVSENNTAYCDIDGNLYTKDKKTLIQYAIGKKDTSFTILDSVTNIGSWAFSNCDSLTSIKVSENNTAYCDIDGNLYSKDKKTLIQYAIGKKDTSIVIPDSVTTIGYYAFAYCDSLTSIVIGDSVTAIGDNAFYYCSSLTSIKIGNGLERIGYFVFSGCYNLEKIFIPDNVTYIGSQVFGGCSRTLTIYCEAESQPSEWHSWWDAYFEGSIVWNCKNVLWGNIVIFKGYSFNEAGSMAVGFDIDYEAKALYEELTGETLEIGVVFAAYDLLLGNQPLDAQGNAVTLDDGAVVKFDLTEYDYTYYDFVVTDIIDSIKDIPLVISAYINNGAENKYIQENGISDTVSGISYNEAKE